MDISEIQASLQSQDAQVRLKAVAALKGYETEVAVPLLLETRHDSEFIIRNFVAKGLGHKRNDAALAGLQEMLRFDRDMNVRAEAANSLSLYGESTVPDLVKAFHKNSHWLLRFSILAAIMDLSAPKALLEISLLALVDPDPVVAQASVDPFTIIVQSDQRQVALNALVEMAQHEAAQVRLHTAQALRKFDEPEAQAALSLLRRDIDHRVVAAALGTLTSEDVG
jgi:HEAT repeat protein